MLSEMDERIGGGADDDRIKMKAKKIDDCDVSICAIDCADAKVFGGGAALREDSQKESTCKILGTANFAYGARRCSSCTYKH